MVHEQRRMSGMKSTVIRKRAGVVAAIYSRTSDRIGQAISARHSPIFGQKQLPHKAPRASDLNVVAIVDRSGCPIQRNRCVRPFSAKIIHSVELNLHEVPQYCSPILPPQKMRPLGVTTERPLCRVHCCLLVEILTRGHHTLLLASDRTSGILNSAIQACLTAVTPTIV